MSDGTGRPAPPKSAVTALIDMLDPLLAAGEHIASADRILPDDLRDSQIHGLLLRALGCLDGFGFDSYRAALTAAYEADAGLVSRAEHERLMQAADGQGLRARMAEHERDELRARLTVVEAERDAALESVDQSNLVEITDRWKASAFEARHAEATLAACREQNTTLREALEAIRAYAVADEPHYDAHRWTTCGEGPCLACLIHSTAETALASVRPAGSTDNENGDEER